MCDKIKQELSYKPIRFNVLAAASHGEHLVLVGIDDDAYDPSPARPFVRNYQWVYDKFVPYDTEIPKPFEPCPRLPHDHKEGFYVEIFLATWDKLAFPVDRPYCNCSPFYDDSSDHLYPPRCHAMAIGVTIAEGLRKGMKIEDISIGHHLLEMPSLSKLVIFGPPTKPKPVPPLLNGLPTLRKGISCLNFN